MKMIKKAAQAFKAPAAKVVGAAAMMASLAGCSVSAGVGVDDSGPGYAGPAYDTYEADCPGVDAYTGAPVPATYCVDATDTEVDLNSNIITGLYDASGALVFNNRDESCDVYKNNRDCIPSNIIGTESVKHRLAGPKQK